jgi:hypothetical protein
VENSRRSYDTTPIRRKRLRGEIEIAKLSPLDLDIPADGRIGRIMLFETGSTDDIALSLVTSSGTMTMALSPQALRRFARLALRVVGDAKGHLDF